MAHALELFSTGEAAFAVARDPAWHRLGTVTPGAMTAGEAIRAAHLADWRVEKRPVFTTDRNGMPVPIKGKFATVRQAPDPKGPAFDALGVVGNDYHVIQNEEAFDFLTAFASSGEALFESAGSLKGGSKVFVTMRLPEALKIVENDLLDLYVGVSNTHDGSEGLIAFPTPIRVVCQNTLSWALRGNKLAQKVRHDSRAEAKMAEAREILTVALTAGEDVKNSALRMLRTRVSANEFDAHVRQHFVPVNLDAAYHVQRRRDEERARLWHLFNEAETQEVGRGTAWAAYNAISEWAEWIRPKDPTTRAAARSVLEGMAAQIRLKALKLYDPAAKSAA